MSSVPMTIEQNVKERIKAIVGELIPEEIWDKVVRETISSFLKTDLPNLVKGEIRDKYKALINEELNKPEWATVWKNGRAGASQMVEEIIKNSAGDILANLIGGISQQVVSNLPLQRY